MTMDGKVIRPDGGWYGLTSRRDRSRMDELRRESQVLLVGTGTLLRDDPILWVRDGDGNPDPASPVPAVVCRHTIPPSRLRLFHGPRPPILFINRTLLKDSAGEDAGFGKMAHIFSLEEERLEPASILEELRKEGWERILLEGGPRMNHAYISADLVDRFHLTIVPYIIGQKGLFGPVNGESAIPSFDARGWHLMECLQEGDELFLTYRRNRG